MSGRSLPVGCCAGPAALTALEMVPGLDFIELPVARALMGGAGELARLAAAIDRSPLRVRAANVFLPADLKVVGPAARPGQLAEYAATALERARRLGVEVLVFGSGAARAVPGGFPREVALDQFERAVRLVNDQARSRGVTLALEPLHSEETNLLNSLAEAAEFIRDLRLDGVRLVADLWHMEREGEAVEVPDRVLELVGHAHVAAAERRPPGQAGDRIEEFLRRLRQAGYAGACSIECRWSDLPAEVPVAVARVREAAAAAGWPA